MTAGTDSGRRADVAGADADDFWRNSAAALRARGRAGDSDVEGQLRRLVEIEQYERLYSVAAQMLTTEGWSPTDDWPPERRQYWRDLENLLATGRSDQPGTASDPAWQLASRLDPTGRPIAIADAVRDWMDRLASRPLNLSDLDESDLDAGDDPDRTVIAVPGLTHLLITELLNELVARVSPGRPIGMVGDGGADLAAVAQGLADQLRSALGAAALAGPGLPGSVPGAGPRPTLRPPQPLAAGLVLPAAVRDLADVAHRAAASLPTPEQLVAAGDYSVRHATAVVAADLRNGLRTPAGPQWRERRESIRPQLHLVTGFRFDAPAGRPVSLAEAAAEMKRELGRLTPPWRPGPGRPLPESTPKAGWMALPDAVALVTAELLDELAARLRPGQWIGTIRISAWPLAQLVQSRLRLRAIAV
ncbi:hypothetical protein [Rugosimonospora africana]|uniref:Uncharacterized protein n=1 Tax=Rugosimonospora africana TaxID=556532 RepID=A0A8J3R4U0_9ACTN|nr:hypothetical protein [Rugosimonospora africana]GIH21335.1 hypothetical protein Raf01_95070 [Rugosimonospora africana]